MTELKLTRAERRQLERSKRTIKLYQKEQRDPKTGEIKKPAGFYTTLKGSPDQDLLKRAYDAKMAQINEMDVKVPT